MSEGTGTEGRLLLGTAKIDITPASPIPLAGYGHRKGPYAGINRRLFARMNVFEQTEGGETRRVLIGMGDIIWWPGERMDPIRETLESKFGIRPSDVILSAQHTHGGPQTSASFCDILGLTDDDYLTYLERQLFAAVETAIANLEPVTAEQGKGESYIGINRRKMAGDKMTMAPNPDGLYDSEVNVVRFRKDDGGTKAVFIHYTCHPTTTGDNFINSDYPGVTAERLEATLGCGAVVSFLQGCAGNIRPALHRDGKFYSGHDEEVMRFGRSLADEVERVLDGPMKTLDQAPLSGSRVVVELPFQPLPSEAELDEAAGKGGHMQQWAEKLRCHPEKLRPYIPFQVNRIALAQGLAYLAMDGEVVLEYGAYAKQLSGGETLAMGYSNGMVGYVPTASQVAEGGYEGKDSFVYFALPAAFDPELESIIKNAIQQLIRKED
jgi:hypothetical protein